MSVIDPFGIGKLQLLVKQTQNIMNTVGTVSANLSKNEEIAKHSPALQSFAKSMETASAKLEHMGEAARGAEQKFHGAELKLQDTEQKLRGNFIQAERQIVATEQHVVEAVQARTTGRRVSEQDFEVAN